MTRRFVWTGCKYGLALGLLAWVVWSYWAPADGSPGLADALRKDIRIAPLLLALLINLIGLLLTFVRWYVLVRAQGLPFTLGSAVRLGLIGYALSTFLPGSVGGDIIRAAFVAREQSRRTVAVATVILDRIIGLVGLFLLVGLLGAVFLAGGWLEEAAASPVAATTLETIVWGAWLLCAGTAGFWLVLGVLSAGRAEWLAGLLGRVPRLGGPLAELWRAVWMYRCQGRSVLLATLLAVVGHVGFVITFYLCALTLSPAAEVPSLGTQFLVVPVGMTIQAVPLFPGGLGVGELGFGELYRLVGFAFATGVLASLVQRVVTWILGLIGYFVYLRMRPSLQPAQKGPEPRLATAEA